MKHDCISPPDVSWTEACRLMRAEKTEVLSNDLLEIERRLDNVRLVCHNAHKKLLGCLQGRPDIDPDKRYKKLPLMGVSQTMVEGGIQLSDETLLGKTLNSCADAEQRLALELSQHEMQIERDILDPLNQLTEVDIPNIQKQRKQLARLVLDWDSARGRYNQAQKSSATNFQMQPGKLDSLKEEMDEAANKVEQCKDQLAADMYNFVSKEGEYGQYFVALLEVQADYHRKALAVLEKALPEIQAQQDKWTEKPAFGTALEEHLKRSSRDIALPIEACVMMLLETGMKEEGLFRIAAGASKLKKLKAALDCSTSQLEEFYSDPHAVAGALKSYLRELPEPLMTFSLYEEWIMAGNVPDQNTKLQSLWCVCQKLPKPNLENFRYLVKFLSKLSHYSDVNKMTPSNIAIVLGPNLLWAKHEGTLAEMAAATSVHVVTIIEPIIQHADWFFPGEVDFNVSDTFVPATPASQHNNLFTGNDVTYEFGILENKKRPASMAIVDDFMKKDSTHKTKEIPTATTPPSLRNGTHQPIAGNGNQLAVVPAQGAANPSPLSLRRGTKKPAPAPPKPVLPPPVQPGSQNLPIAANAPPAIAAKPSNHSQTPSPPNSTSNQSGNVASTTHSYGTIPRRHSSSQPAIQAPSHPPPQPPTQPALQAKPNTPPTVTPTTDLTTEQSSSPSHSPTPPDTPPPIGEHPGSQGMLPEATQTQPSPPQTFGTLPRPRPVPKPRVRPTVPPPPQPPTSHPSGDTQSSSASKVITDPIQAQPVVESVCPVPAADHPNLPIVLLDTDVESTAL
ncbi:rho GTPase-activating protein 17 isoform X5 [Hyperolius riggenbachi]|uniref:rho GTPase-activating protein 17 isoform X5 n=1 Tax=Hyperolius riggenbachi TaxID=752182 RepID=UPI0035A363A0